ncbi:IclR family transcriptional regulator [Phytoactinopolyspora halotolerans]|uniref:IclR family transcriptional regulator n=1 Tax=Phytoactinopolyspora halotolerans TaxID=1981512 RepID=A0A6L9SBW0_9ACTN|nr:IclR family transcriptional regulator [Phytoactinopolyspora halotolerans]NEE02746.1 IclR family transcriptional regulator [Phytoactinopolyspora halotolerans]
MSETSRWTATGWRSGVADGTRGTDRPEEAERVVGAERVLVVLRELATRPDGASLDELSRAVGGAKPTIHRALASLRRVGFAAQDERGRYQLGDEFLRLAFSYHEQRPEHVRIRPALAKLVARFGETAHYAVIDGHEIVYRAKVDPPSGAVKLTSEVGGRGPLHSTAVGKVLLAYAAERDPEMAEWALSHPHQQRTQRTVVDGDALMAELAATRERGYAVDDEENEEGVACVAVPVWMGATHVPRGAVSVSAVAYRTPLRTMVDAVEEIRAIVDGNGTS